MERFFDTLAAVLDWVARLTTTLPVHVRTPETEKGRSPSYIGPRPGRQSAHSRFAGRSWSYDGTGVRVEGALWRTPGEPVTCRTVFATCGEHILAAANRHGVNPALIVMTVAVETGRFRQVRFTGPHTFRWEAHVPNRDLVLPFNGTYSAGPMQILATTARDLIARRGSDYGLGYEPFSIAPALPAMPVQAPASLPLYNPAANIDLGTAVIRRAMPLTGDDPLLVAAAYNSGGLYETQSNPWHLRSYGDHLDRAARWYGDACAVLREVGVL